MANFWNTHQVPKLSFHVPMWLENFCFWKNKIKKKGLGFRALCTKSLILENGTCITFFQTDNINFSNFFFCFRNGQLDLFPFFQFFFFLPRHVVLHTMQEVGYIWGCQRPFVNGTQGHPKQGVPSNIKLGIVFLGSKTSCLSLGDDGMGLGDDRDRLEG